MALFKDLPFVSICYSSSFVRSLTNLLTFVSSVMGFYISQPTSEPPGDYFATARTLVGECLRTSWGLLGTNQMFYLLFCIAADTPRDSGT